jgi:hypothetical protein
MTHTPSAARVSPLEASIHALTTQEMPKNGSVDEGETTMPLVHIDLQKGKTSEL